MTPSEAEATVTAAMRQPNSGDWGYFTRDVGLSTVGMFRWFSSRADMLATLATAELSFGDEPEQEYLQAMSALLIEGGAVELSDSVRARVNEIADGMFHLEWWGTFEALCGATNPDWWVAGVRESFRELDEGDEGAAPISGDEQGDFAAFVQEYGF